MHRQEETASPHISDADLVQFADGELPVRALNITEIHLRTCYKCRSRLDELKSGADTYHLYHQHVLKPNLEIQGEWPSLQARMEKLTKPRTSLMLAGAVWWSAAALLCLTVAVGWFVYREAPSRRMQQVLARATVAHRMPHRRLQVVADGHSWYRDAMFENETVQHSLTAPQNLTATRALFVRANYSWDDPLSVRSFSAWRRQLTEKRDEVLSIEDPEGKNRFYRLQTKTRTGYLRTAALTLRADNLNPVKGSFHFEDRRDVTMEDAGETTEAATILRGKQNHPDGRRAVIREVGPKEELRVFAALNAIGADVGEPLTVSIDSAKQHIVVGGVGLPSSRERAIRQALIPIPNLALHFTSGQAAVVSGQGAPAGTYTSDNAGPLRPLLEKRAGGAQQLQLIADRALDASSVILAQANALYVLSQKFNSSVTSAFGPSDRETLRDLRHRHATVIEQTLIELKDNLNPLFNSQISATNETKNPRATSWENGTGQLYEQAKLLDASLGRLLAGNYARELGENLWKQLPDEIQKMELLARSQENTP
jgi:hypothetical protein